MMLSSTLTRTSTKGLASLAVRDTATPTSSRPLANLTATSRGSAPKFASTKCKYGTQKYPSHLVLLLGCAAWLLRGRTKQPTREGIFSQVITPRGGQARTNLGGGRSLGRMGRLGGWRGLDLSASEDTTRRGSERREMR